ncbi:MAG: hypothetical protein Kow0029_02130 [Candidatus Rifleibacteriota bacterium]
MIIQQRTRIKKGLPNGHVKIDKFLTVPFFIDGKIIGVVGVANKENDYDETDALQLQLLLDPIWKTIRQKETTEKLRQIEWMLSQAPEEKSEFVAPFYGDLARYNTDGLIKKLVEPVILKRLIGEFIYLVGSAANIYEREGGYAMAVLSTDWCRLLNEASRKLCKTADNNEAMKSGAWLCHESCWTKCSKRAIEEKKPVDIVCSGGINLYSVPIFASGKAVGAISLGYGDPPRDQATIEKIASRYQVGFHELKAASESYKSRPRYIVEMARQRLNAVAKMIGSLVATRLAENQLRQAVKMEAIGRLAGGIAHDFNNMLSVILGHAEMALLETNDNDLFRVDLENIIAAARRSAELTQQLLAFARKQTNVPQIFDLKESVGQLLKMLKRLIGENIDLVFNASEHAAIVKMDPTQIDQILINLVLNAKEAIDGSGKIVIKTEISEVKDKNDFIDFLQPGHYCVLSVSDDGCGMTKEVQEQIFEPFFTTRPEGKGTGLGLATVYGIVKQNKGDIRVYSEPGRGTTFKVYLPLVIEAEAGEALLKKEKEELRIGNETILLIEDDALLLRLTNSMLARLGYNVLTAHSPEAALKIVDDYQDNIDMVLTDVVMPGMNGRELFGLISKKRPALKCLYISGYPADVLSSQDSLLHDYVLLEKPFNLLKLSKKLRQILDT